MPSPLRGRLKLIWFARLQTFSSAWTTARSGYEDDKEEIFERPRKIRRVKEELS